MFRKPIHNKLRFMISGLLSAALLVTAGCGAQVGNKESQNKGKTTVVKHAMGETKVKGKPKRVVVLTNEGLEALLSVGVKPVGAVRAFSGGGTWYPHLEKKMKGVKDVGLESQPNLEAIAALKPDLIIGNKIRQEKVYNQLSAIAPTVFAEQLSGDWQDNLKLYTTAVGKKDEGKKVISDFDKRVKSIKANLKKEGKQDTKVSVVRFLPGQTRIYYKDSFPGVILDQVGLKRPKTQEKNEFAKEVTKERIPDMDGDALFYFTYQETGKGKEGSEIEKEWTQDGQWKKLDAVKNKRAYKVDDIIWTTAGGVEAANLLLDDIEKYLLKK
ncbi:iron complex transport system substrate-binding protein [Marininema mesophilum]|uniref:Iron complex transport system substrate-binding protein n=1 Tax=Marininema mesophilum TaxID=1048340 RepID=A0A1H3A4T0_9BACL|nr:iron-siderophore ABC transporter substrate-binding protein [Marininema mesophilum]SDX24204.1 iron complex transport system substrate-binding protein [Marininema mesophilum]